MIREPDAIDLALSEAGKLLGRRGGSTSSQSKAAAARVNGKLGGRPPKYWRFACPECHHHGRASVDCAGAACANCGRIIYREVAK